MKPLWNLTHHQQSPPEIDLAATFGFFLEAEPRGEEIPAGQAGLQAAVDRLANTLTACQESAAAALIGGHAGLWVAAILAARERSLPLPPLYCFDTPRRRDENGRFQFVAEGLLKVTDRCPPIFSARIVQNLQNGRRLRKPARLNAKNARRESPSGWSSLPRFDEVTENRSAIP
jgi:hypothetical protein